MVAYGTLITGPLADRYGRKALIIVACIIFLLGIATIIAAHHFWSLLLARWLLGIGVGVVAVASPLYLSEMAPAAIRGKCVGVFQLFLTFGVLLAYLIDIAFTPSGDWRAMFVVIIIPASILLIGMILLPDTKRRSLEQVQAYFEKRAFEYENRTPVPATD